MQLQETGMTNSQNRGSDPDIFEGLGKKPSERLPAAPPAPPGSPATPGSQPPALVRPQIVHVDAKRTLLGIPEPAGKAKGGPVSVPPPLPKGPPPSGQLRAAPSSNPLPPPGRGALPAVPGGKSSPPGEPARTSQRAPRSVPPPLPQSKPPVGPPASDGAPTIEVAQAKAGSLPKIEAMPKSSPKLDMDWDDDEEATHVYVDVEKEGFTTDESSKAVAAPASEKEKKADRASMDAIMSAPPRTSSMMPAVPQIPPAAALPTATALPASAPPPAHALPSAVPPPKHTTGPAPKITNAPDPAGMSGAFGALGQPERQSAPPISEDTVNATQPFTRPPPPPGQVTTAPMHMPPMGGMAKTMPSMAPNASGQARPISVPPPANGAMPPAHASMPPPAHMSHAPAYGMHNRAMEATHMVRREPGRSPALAIGIIGILGAAAAALFLFLPRSGTLVVNVADAKGGAVSALEVLVDGTKRCEAAPCILRDMPAGVHEVKITAKGFDPPAPRAVTVESRHDTSADFQLSSSKNAAGTGFKVAAPQAGVKLLVDGKDVGPLPQELRDLQPGEHKLTFKGDRYAPQEKTISVGKDEIVDLGNVALKVIKGKATIQLGTAGAKVYLVNGTNRKEVPQFPMAIEFDPSEKWDLLGAKDGFEDFRETIAFEDGQAEKTYNVTLTAKGVKAPPTPPAVAFVPPQPAAPREPAPPAPKAAPPKDVAPAKAPAEAAPAAAAPAAPVGETVLKINSLPASTVTLDGKPLGGTPQLHVVTTPGTHTITFVNAEQSLNKTISVEIKAGETKAAFAKLRE